VMAAVGPGGRTTIQLTLHRQSPQEQQRPRMMGRDMWSVLPAIRAPRGASQQAEGGSGSPDRLSANAPLETALDLPSVVTHYTEELTRAGWERRDGGEAGPAAWSACNGHILKSGLLASHRHTAKGAEAGRQGGIRRRLWGPRRRRCRAGGGSRRISRACRRGQGWGYNEATGGCTFLRGRRERTGTWRRRSSRA